MKTQRLLILGFGLTCLASTIIAADWPQWRGPNRDGVSPEKGLLGEWPSGGPKLLWQVNHCGSGYSTPAVADGRIYLPGNEGLENEFVQALAIKDGARLWQTRLGKVGNPNQDPKFPAARSTPTVDGKVMFVLGSDGDLVCVETGSGKERWRKSLRRDFGGKPGTWAYSESPLVNGSAVLVTPGGSEATLVALDKKTGELIWKCAVPGGDEAAYSSMILVDVDGQRQCVQVLSKGLVGVDAKTGKFLWRYDRTVSKYKANIPTPIAHKEIVYSAGSGTGGGAIKLKKGTPPEQVYFSPKLPLGIGTPVLLGEHMYGTANQGLICAEFATGNTLWQDRAIGPASICYADGRLYLHGENGEVALVEATTAGYREKGRFSPPGRPSRINPMEKSWAYPVVADGKLFIRDHGMLWCYDVRGK